MQSMIFMSRIQLFSNVHKNEGAFNHIQIFHYESNHLNGDAMQSFYESSPDFTEVRNICENISLF